MNQKLSFFKAQAIFWLFLFAVFVGLIILFNGILLPFVIGAIVAYLLNPLVRILGQKGMKRWVASILILSAFSLFIVALIAISAPLLAREFGEFISSVPQYTQRISSIVQSRLSILEQRTGFDFMDKMHASIEEDIGKTLQMSQKVVGGVAAGLMMGGSAIVGFVTTALLVPIVAYFMMKDWPRITGFVHNLIPKAHKATINSLLDQIDRKISGFIRGQLSVCLILGVMYAIALSIAGLEYGSLIGLGTGLLSIIPYVGSTIGLLSSIGVAALQTDGDMTYVATIAAIFFTGQFIEGNFITPKLIGDSVGLHPLWIIFALMAGGSLVGLTGMLMAIPVAAIISVLIGFAIQTYKNSDFYKTPEKVSPVITDATNLPEIEIIIKTES
ncbi:MAG: AI-2E family transporter [Micavibrio aeruginosavorus]|uniref:AI-2E family transporter n=1 Tax=Micavibrio aeruginosavorus TaxID=349221 RepID=A0A2W5FM80_9BACT|nr:MAG: AI-2E family transporter [Micavibrio aeruginosavorus]